MKEDFDPEWIIELVRQQKPERTDVIDALRNCKNGIWESKAYIYFVSPLNANQNNSEWQFKENVVLEHKKEGTIVIDILDDNRIGGIEFVSKISY